MTTSADCFFARSINETAFSMLERLLELTSSCTKASRSAIRINYINKNTHIIINSKIFIL